MLFTMPLNHWKRAILVAVLVGRCEAQEWRGNQINISMCTWGEVRASTIRDTVYLDGGNLWWQLGYENGELIPSNRNNKDGLLYYLNLSSSFNTATTNLTGLFGSIAKSGGIANNLAPTYHDGVMFANDYKFYLYGGLLLPTDSQDDPPGDAVLAYERYQYGPYSNLWEPGFINTNLDNVSRYVTHGAGVSPPSENLGFYVSGMRAPDWGPIYDNQSATSQSDRMIRVDMSDMRNPEWSNLSLPEYVPARANAEAVWIPVSESGVLVLIGGVPYPESIFRADGLTSAQGNASARLGPALMETVSVYDIAGDRWYVQNTTGDIPPQLTQFCSVYASASDGSSHNIYIYGGYDGLDPTQAPSDDVYLLSLPSFEWIRLYEGDNRAHGRKEHKCIKPYPDRMLILGGVAINPSDCLEMIQVFSLNTGRFQDTYNPDEWNEYRVPDLVSGRIGGDYSGGATKTSPDSWTNSSLADVFAATYTKPIGTWYPYNGTSAAQPTPNPGGGSSSFPAWAGAIIGVLLGLLVIALAVGFWLLRRRRKSKGSQHVSEVAGDRSRVMQWMYSGRFGPDAAKDNENATVVSGGYTNDTTIAPSGATAMSRPTAEAGSEPVYEVHGHSATAAVELPTSYNEYPLPTPSSTLSATRTEYGSPVSPETPLGDEAEGSPTRPIHHRNVSSLSSVRSLEEGRIGQRPRYVSGVSEMSISTEGTRTGDLGITGRGLEDIPDTEDR